MYKIEEETILDWVSAIFDSICMCSGQVTIGTWKDYRNAIYF